MSAVRAADYNQKDEKNGKTIYAKPHSGDIFVVLFHNFNERRRRDR